MKKFKIITIALISTIGLTGCSSINNFKKLTKAKNTILDVHEGRTDITDLFNDHFDEVEKETNVEGADELARYSAMTLGENLSLQSVLIGDSIYSIGTLGTDTSASSRDINRHSIIKTNNSGENPTDILDLDGEEKLAFDYQQAITVMDDIIFFAPPYKDYFYEINPKTGKMTEVPLTGDYIKFKNENIIITPDHIYYTRKGMGGRYSLYRTNLLGNNIEPLIENISEDIEIINNKIVVKTYQYTNKEEFEEYLSNIHEDLNVTDIELAKFENTFTTPTAEEADTETDKRIVYEIDMITGEVSLYSINSVGTKYIKDIRHSVNGMDYFYLASSSARTEGKPKHEGVGDLLKYNKEEKKYTEVNIDGRRDSGINLLFYVKEKGAMYAVVIGGVQFKYDYKLYKIKEDIEMIYDSEDWQISEIKYEDGSVQVKRKREWIKVD